MHLLKIEFGRCEVEYGLARGRMTGLAKLNLAAVRGFRGKATNGLSLTAFLLLLGIIKRVSTVGSILPRLPPSPCLVEGSRGGTREVHRAGQ